MSGRFWRLGLMVVVLCGGAAGTALAGNEASPPGSRVQLLYAPDDTCLVKETPSAGSSRRRSSSGWRDPVISILAAPVTHRLARCQSRIGAVRCLGRSH